MNEDKLIAFSALKRMMLIINPVSGRRTSLRFLPDIIHIFNQNGYAVTVFPTGKSGDATAFAKEYAEQFDIIVAIGGDGTLNEVITGLIEGGHDKPIGYIPSGSTNDFAATQGIPTDMLTAAMNIATGEPRKLDVGRFGDRYFAYIAAFGAFTWMAYSTSQDLKNVFGYSAYIFDGVKDLPKLKPHHLVFENEGKRYEGDYIFGVISNSYKLTGIITLPSDMVEVADGKFEVFLVHQPQTLLDWQTTLASIINQDFSSPFVELFQTSKLTVQGSENCDWSIDGERGEGSDKIDIEILREKITIIC